MPADSFMGNDYTLFGITPVLKRTEVSVPNKIYLSCLSRCGLTAYSGARIRRVLGSTYIAHLKSGLGQASNYHIAHGSTSYYKLEVCSIQNVVAEKAKTSSKYPFRFATMVEGSLWRVSRRSMQKPTTLERQMAFGKTKVYHIAQLVEQRPKGGVHRFESCCGSNMCLVTRHIGRGHGDLGVVVPTMLSRVVGSKSPTCTRCENR